MPQHRSKAKRAATNTSDAYLVQKILKVRWRKNKQECLIKWQGFSSEHNSWVPRQNVTTFESFIDEKDDDQDYQEKWTMPKELAIRRKGSELHHYGTRHKNRRRWGQERGDEYETTEGLEDLKRMLLPPEKQHVEEVQIVEHTDKGEQKTSMDSKNVVKNVIEWGGKKGPSQVELWDGRRALIQSQDLSRNYSEKVIAFLKQIVLRQRAYEPAIEL